MCNLELAGKGRKSLKKMQFLQISAEKDRSELRSDSTQTDPTSDQLDDQKRNWRSDLESKRIRGHVCVSGETDLSLRIRAIT